MVLLLPLAAGEAGIAGRGGRGIVHGMNGQHHAYEHAAQDAPDPGHGDRDLDPTRAVRMIGCCGHAVAVLLTV